MCQALPPASAIEAQESGREEYAHLRFLRALSGSSMASPCCQCRAALPQAASAELPDKQLPSTWQRTQTYFGGWDAHREARACGCNHVVTLFSAGATPAALNKPLIWMRLTLVPARDNVH